MISEGKEERFSINVIPEIPEEVEKFKSRFAEILSSKEKRQIFMPSIQAMKKIAQEHQISLPEEEVLFSRLFVVDQETFRQVLEQEGKEIEVTNPQGIKIGDAAAFTLANRIILLNGDAADLKGRLNRRRKPLLRKRGLHELWHSIAYSEEWMANPSHKEFKFLPKNLYRRDGIYTRYPDYHKRKYGSLHYSRGLKLLQEGFMDYCVRITLERAGEPPVPNQSYSYLNEMRVVEKLVEKIGDNPLFQASFTKNGFRTLFLALGGKLRDFAEKMRDEYQSHTAVGLGGPDFRYPKTLEFIAELDLESNSPVKSKQQC